MQDERRGMLVRQGEGVETLQGFRYAAAISAETVGATGLHMHRLEIPPGGRAKAHRHERHETGVYAVSGTSNVWHGSRLQFHTAVLPGTFFYIPAGVPHLPYNASSTEPCVVLIARTDPNEQEGVVLMPELEALAPVWAPLPAETA